MRLMKVRLAIAYLRRVAGIRRVRAQRRERPCERLVDLTFYPGERADVEFSEASHG